MRSQIPSILTFKLSFFNHAVTYNCSLSVHLPLTMSLAVNIKIRNLYVALREVYAVYAFAASRLVDVAVHFVCLCVEAS